MIVRSVIRSTALLTIVISMERTKTTPLLLSHQCFNNLLFQHFENYTNFDLLYFSKMVLLGTSLSMYDTISTIVFLTDGLEEVVLFYGLHVHQT